MSDEHPKRQLKVATSEEVEPSLPSERSAELPPRPRKKCDSVARQQKPVTESTAAVTPSRVRTPALAPDLVPAKASTPPPLASDCSELKASREKQSTAVVTPSRVRTPAQAPDLVPAEASTPPPLASDCPESKASREKPVTESTAAVTRSRVRTPDQAPDVVPAEASTPPSLASACPELTPPKRTATLEGFAKSGILAGQVEVQWPKADGVRSMAAERGRTSRKGLQVKLHEGRVIATTRGLARDVELSSDRILRIHDSYASEGRATFVVEENLDGQVLVSNVLLSKARPDQLLTLLGHFRP